VQQVNEDIRSGAREARLNGEKILGADRARYSIKRDSSVPWGWGDIFLERDGVRLPEVDGKLLLGEPRPGPAQVEVVNWSTKLWRRLFREKVVPEPPAASRPAKREPRSMKEWFPTALEDIQQKDGEKDVDYLDRLIKATPEQFRGEWKDRTYSNRLYEHRKRALEEAARKAAR
jgi:hypothetical protein